jgi:thiamine kinase-like enzyme
VLDVIEEHLTNFSSSLEMISVLVDALKGKWPLHHGSALLISSTLAHEDAYNKAGVLHRDISVGNIMITKGHGILIDWDLSKWVKQDPSVDDKVRQPM